jgi:putative selenium metabolism hydrolase
MTPSQSDYKSHSETPFATGGVDSRSWEVISLCQELVRIKSLPGQEAQAAQWAASQMKRLGFEQVQQDAAGNVSGQWKGIHPGPTLFFDAHLDTVPADQPENWSYPPFNGEIAEGRLWGRGSTDTKGSLAAMLTAVSSLPRNEIHGRVVLLASVHEENMTGAAVSLALDAFQPDIFVTGEPTNLAIAVAQKGRVTFDLVASGRSAHTSRPEIGQNSVYSLMEAISRIRQAPKPYAPDLGSEILELTEITSQPYPNRTFVPHSARARFVGRILPGETWPSFQLRIQDLLSGMTNVEIHLSCLRERSYTGLDLELEDFLPGWRCPDDNPWLARLVEGLEGAGLSAQTFSIGCGTNASSAAQRGISCFIYGPGSLEHAHVIDEWVSLDQLVNAVHGYHAFARACLRG